MKVKKLLKKVNIEEIDIGNYNNNEIKSARAAIGRMRAISSFLSWSALPMVRYSFGERGFNWLYFMGFSGFYFWYCTPSNIFPYIYLLCGLANGFYIIARRAFFDEPFYSLTHGYSITYLVVDFIKQHNDISISASDSKIKKFAKERLFSEHSVRMYYEPIMFYVFASIFINFGIDYIANYIFIASSASLFIKQYYDGIVQRSIILDHRDSRIEAGIVKDVSTEAVSKKEKKEKEVDSGKWKNKKILKGYPLEAAISVNQVIKETQKENNSLSDEFKAMQFQQKI